MTFKVQGGLCKSFSARERTCHVRPRPSGLIVPVCWAGRFDILCIGSLFGEFSFVYLSLRLLYVTVILELGIIDALSPRGGGKEVR